MAEPKSRIVLRFFAVVIACLFFALLATGLIQGLQLHQIVLQSAMMVVFLVFGLFGLKPAETLLRTLHSSTQRKPPSRAGAAGFDPAGNEALRRPASATPKSSPSRRLTSVIILPRACRHIVAGELQGPVAGLAICKYEADAGYYLLYCDPEWNPITDTRHDTVEDAKHQAETEYAGVSSTWQHLEESR